VSPSNRRIRAIARRDLLAQHRNPGYWFLLLVIPIVDGIMFPSIGGAFGEGDQPVRLLVSGIMLFHLIWQLTLAGSMGLLEEVWSRNLLNLIATPLTEREFVGALGLVGAARTAVSVAMIGVVGVVVHAVEPTAAGWVLLPAAAVLLTFGWAVTLFVIGLVLQHGDSAEVFSWGTLLLLMPISGVFYPIEALPGPLQALAGVVPLTHVFEAVQHGLRAGEVAWGSIGVAAVGTVVILVAATAFVRRQVRRFRSEGWVTRFT